MIYEGFCIRYHFIVFVEINYISFLYYQTSSFAVIAWILQKKNARKMNTVEMRSLRGICGVSLVDRIHNEEIHRMAVTSEDVTLRIKKTCSAGLGTSNA